MFQSKKRRDRLHTMNTTTLPAGQLLCFPWLDMQRAQKLKCSVRKGRTLYFHNVQTPSGLSDQSQVHLSGLWQLFSSKGTIHHKVKTGFLQPVVSFIISPDRGPAAPDNPQTLSRAVLWRDYVLIYDKLHIVLSVDYPEYPGHNIPKVNILVG